MAIDLRILPCKLTTLIVTSPIELPVNAILRSLETGLGYYARRPSSEFSIPVRSDTVTVNGWVVTPPKPSSAESVIEELPTAIPVTVTIFPLKIAVATASFELVVVNVNTSPSGSVNSEPRSMISV